MKTILPLILFLSASTHAAIYVPYGPLSHTAFLVGEGPNEELAKQDALSAIPKGFQESHLLWSPIMDCYAEPGKCKYFIPLEPTGKKELSEYKELLDHHEAATLFSGYGQTMEDAEKDLLLQTGKKSLSAFVGNVTRWCPVDYKGRGSEKCMNRTNSGTFRVEAPMPKSCFLTE